MKRGHLIAVTWIFTMILGGYGAANVIKANVTTSNTVMVSGNTTMNLSLKMTGGLKKRFKNWAVVYRTAFNKFISLPAL